MRVAVLFPASLLGVETPEVALLVVPEQMRQNLPAAARSAARYLGRPCFGSQAVPDALYSSDFINT